MKILVIGAGWYGCHIASTLLKNEIDVDIYEAGSEIFTQASSKNQNRLHLGFHYPRCSVTRAQSRRGFFRFKQEYGFLCRPILFNLYCVPKKKSIIDFETYKLIVKDLGFQADLSDVTPVNLRGMAGVISCQEELIDFERAKNHFQNELESNITFNRKVHPSELSSLQDEYDFVVDCTWGGISRFSEDIIYESNLFHIYKKRNRNINFSITVMDGDFFSLFPWANNEYSLTNVRQIKVNEFSEKSDAIDDSKRIFDDKVFCKSHRESCENQVSEYYPDFLNSFEYVRPITSVKTKMKSNSDSRSVHIEREGNLLKVFSGKIDTVFDAEYILMKEILK